MTGLTEFGGLTEGRFATLGPPGFVVGFETLGRPPPEGLNPPPAGRGGFAGLETFPMDGPLPPPGRETLGLAALPPPPPVFGRPPPPPTAPIEGRPPPPPRSPLANVDAGQTTNDTMITTHANLRLQLVFMRILP